MYTYGLIFSPNNSDRKSTLCKFRCVTIDDCSLGRPVAGLTLVVVLVVPLFNKSSGVPAAPVVVGVVVAGVVVVPPADVAEGVVAPAPAAPIVVVVGAVFRPSGLEPRIRPPLPPP